MDEIRPTYLGNEELLTKKKVAFLAPSHVSPLAILPTYDWVTETVKRGETIVSGFTSALEKDVWRLAAHSGGTMILVMVRASFKSIPDKYHQLLSEGRLLIIFLGIASRLCRQNAPRRNAYVCQIADSIVFPSMNSQSSLYPLFRTIRCHKPTNCICSQ